MIVKIVVQLLLVSIVVGSPANDNDIRTRILDGEYVPGVNFYEVAIVSENDGTAIKVCTGAILNQRWILTSAYCAKRKASLRVQFGTAELDASGDVGQLVYRKHIHPSYSPGVLMHDIALLEMNPVLTGHIKKVLLPTTTVNTYVGAVGTVSGWGATGSYLDYNPILSSKKVNIIDVHYCQQAGNSISPYKLCSEGRVTCEGDQGAPLVVDGTIVGIVSEALNALTCESQISVTYTRVNYYLGWINQVTNRLAL